MIKNVRPIVLCYGVAMSVLVFTGCSKKEDETKETSTTTTTTPLTPEQNKSNLAASGTEFVKDMNDLKNMKSLDATDNLSSLIETSDPFASSNKAYKLSPIKALLALGRYHRTGDFRHVDRYFKTAEEEAPESIQAIFDDVKGKYTWDAGNKTWVKTTSSNLILEFPTAKDGTSNNASYTVSYTGYTAVKPIPDYDGDLPQVVTAKLVADGTTLLSFALNATYNSDGYPSLTTVALDVVPYHINVSLKYTTPLVAYNFGFKRNDKTLLDYGFNAKGNFSKENLEKLTDSTEKEFGDIKKYATAFDAHFQVLNIVLKGDVNITGFVDAVNAKGGDPDNLTKQQALDCINPNYHLGLYYAKEGTLIAKSEFYLTTKTDTYTDWVCDGMGPCQEVTKTETREDIDVRAIFADSSKADLETYFGKGFEQVFDDFEALISDLDSKYGNKK